MAVHGRFQSPVFRRWEMSFEVYLQCYDRGQPSSGSADAIRSAFGPVEADSQPDYWHLRYSQGNECHVSVASPEGKPDRIEAMTVVRPCGDGRLWTSLYTILQSGQWVLYFPSEPPPILVADKANAKHLPPDMLEVLGPVVRVRSGDHIARLVANPPSQGLFSAIKSLFRRSGGSDLP